MIRNIRKVSLWAYLFLFFLSFQVYAQAPAWETDDYSNLFKLEAYHFTGINKSNATPAEVYLNAYQGALRFIVFDDISEEEVQQTLNTALEQIKKSPLSEQLSLYYQIDLLMLSAHIELKKGNELRFMWLMNDIYKNSQHLIINYPEFLPGKKIAGTLLIMISTVPDQYQWVINLLGYYGNSEQGLKYLETLNNSTIPVKYESLLLSALLKKYLTIENKSNLLVQLEKVISENPQFSLMRFIAALAYIKEHQSKEAQDHLLKIKDINSPIISYLLAETFLHQGNHFKAINYYKEFISLSNGGNLVKDAYSKIYISHYIIDNTVAAERYKTLALHSGEANTETDKNAQQLLNESSPAHPAIFQIRYYTDGGYYHKALQLADSAFSLSLNNKDKIELNYRLARIKHLKGDIKDAINLYKESIENHDGRYFAPNASLQLGIIYLSLKKNQLAKMYFEQVLEYKNYTYENSIKGKARRALKNLEQ
ncbi:MAG: tetratricopeptide repeat protein [Candidatus Cyclobacteriaceae bacterium M2_1C_046]